MDFKQPASSQGIGPLPHDSGTSFRVWAPNAEAVYVIGSFNGWSKKQHPLSRDKAGVWSADVPGAKPGDEYKYRIVAGGKELLRNDPYAQDLTSSVGNSIIHDPRFDWGDDGFQATTLDRMVIYEMHLGTFCKGAGDHPGNIECAVQRLPYLRELGINAVELMPVMEFPGAYSWGYNPAQIFAFETDYGDVAGFKSFVKAAHEHGIAVILDVVYSHFGPSDLNLWQFDGWSESGKGGIYFYNDWRSQTPWGDTRPDYGRPQVRRFIRDNALMWIEEYHLDGLRWDATAFIRNAHGYEGDPGSDIPEGWQLMQRVNNELKARRPNVISIAEDLRDNAYMTKNAKDGGAGFDAQWDVRFVHRIREAIVSADDTARNLDAVRDAIVHRYYLDAFERVIYTESHDEVANGKARVPEEIAPGNAATWEARKRSTLGACLVFTAPGLPMIFQGQEFLEDDWFQDKDPIDWSKRERFAGILRLYRALIRLRLNGDGVTAGLCGQEVSVYHVNHKAKLLAFHRWAKGGPRDSVVVVVNMANALRENYIIGFPRPGAWHIRFNSDAQEYDPGFSGAGASEVKAEETGRDGLPARGSVTVGPYSALIVSQDG